ncbi:MAG: N(4)-(beta-N-acetylglucosaminyl)-L-asparaginase [Pirellulales bacterium]|nr:N(4)-(beta-N-acetylglucosaminyl)-L-asparaginase [Pirellulales bacterium]
MSHDSHQAAGSRREFLAGSAGSLAGVALAGAAFTGATLADAAAADPNVPKPSPAKTGRTAVTPLKVISSKNGLETTRKAYELIAAGGEPLNAIVQGIEIVENDPNDTSVGYGGLPNEDGVVELDAAVMHGPTHRCGAVAALRNVRHPTAVAKLVMEQTDHVLLVGEGALRFARAQGFPEENLLTEKARKTWLYWRQTRSTEDDWLPPAEVPPEWKEYLTSRRPTGTIHCAALVGSDLFCATSTSGLAFKLPGRVGDSPIVGAGLYCDNDAGSCGSTGRGEANLQNLSSRLAVELMRTGKTAVDAGLEVMRQIAKHTEPRLLDAEGRPNFELKLYLLSKRDGGHAGVSMWPAQFSITDERGTRLEDCVPLFERKS